MLSVPVVNRIQSAPRTLRIRIVPGRRHQQVRIVFVAVPLEPRQAARDSLLQLLYLRAAAEMPSMPFDVRIVSEPCQHPAPIGSDPIKRISSQPEIIAASDKKVQSCNQILHTASGENTRIGPREPGHVVL